MAAPNDTLGDMFCSPGITVGLHGHLTFLSVLHSLLSVTTFLGNALILIALHKESSLHPPSKFLLRSLATTDLCVGVFAEPLVVTYWVSMMNTRWVNICPYVIAATLMIPFNLFGVSVGTLTAISVDRLLALLLGLRYKQVVTIKRTYVIAITLWFLPAVFSAMYFWNPLITFSYGIMSIPLCLIISIISYTKIFLTLRHHQHQVQDHVQQPHQTNQLNIARYQKAVFSALWLQLTMVACYLPCGILTALCAKSGLSTSLYLAGIYAATLVYLNSSLNPILYCWKIDEVRQAVKDTIRHVLCFCFSS